ncbi:hypothetical protein C8Q78DRAFT_620371 [Trametes maxima]|nr:hypothetical protein C8Q78DRAFT_620371 [Trametes maxima]
MHLNRHQNFSHKKRREQMMLKRAVKRGDVPAPPPSRPDRRVRKPRNARNDDPSADIQAEAARRLQSAFIKLPPQFVKDTEILSATLPLTRPIPPEAAILADVDQRSNAVGGPSSLEEGLSCPRRPEWNYDMTKDELEANEEARFQQWLAQSDAVAHAWCNTDSTTDSNTEDREPEQMPHAPTTFERNLEVWRQLWRVTETSQILLILLDSRCPTLHFPPALVSYLASPSIASRLRVILVLTKVDIAGPERAAAWTRHLKARYPGVRVVQVESFAEKEPDGNDSKKRQYEPHLPPAFRQALVDALRETHAELLEPLEEVKSDPGRLAQWKPHVRSHVDWDTVLSARGGQADSSAKSGGAYPDSHPSEEHSDEKTEPDILTIGLIGQPNVGKSSLLNAMFGTYKVKASRQPGKTKHFQTLFWTPEVRLVDCPGLIFPNYVPMETQILTGILPISRVSAIPLTIHHAAQLIPLEKVLDLEHPSLAEPPAEDKRTWRAGMHPRSAAEQLQKRQTPWTAMDIMTAYASKKNWITARVGRPDVKRAGNASAYPHHSCLFKDRAHVWSCHFFAPLLVSHLSHTVTSGIRDAHLRCTPTRIPNLCIYVWALVRPGPFVMHNPIRYRPTMTPSHSPPRTRRGPYPLGILAPGHRGTHNQHARACRRWRRHLARVRPRTGGRRARRLRH